MRSDIGGSQIVPSHTSAVASAFLTMSTATTTIAGGVMMTGIAAVVTGITVARVGTECFTVIASITACRSAGDRVDAGIKLVQQRRLVRSSSAFAAASTSPIERGVGGIVVAGGYIGVITRVSAGAISILPAEHLNRKISRRNVLIDLTTLYLHHSVGWDVVYLC
jgi:hypothetical protein